MRFGLHFIAVRRVGQNWCWVDSIDSKKKLMTDDQLAQRLNARAQQVIAVYQKEWSKTQHIGNNKDYFARLAELEAAEAAEAEKKGGGKKRKTRRKRRRKKRKTRRKRRRKRKTRRKKRKKKKD